MATDAIELLTSDHRTVETLFDEYQRADDAAKRGEIVRDIIHELSVHAAIEEQILYPMSRRSLPNGEELVDDDLREHQQAKQLLAELEKTEPTDPAFDQKVRQLRKDIEHHVADEEGELFPGLREHVSADVLARAGEAMAAAKAMAPTHPHPHAPNTPPGNIVAGPMAAVVDKARDLARGLFSQ